MSDIFQPVCLFLDICYMLLLNVAVGHIYRDTLFSQTSFVSSLLPSVGYSSLSSGSLRGGEHIYVPITVFLGFMEGTHWWPLSCFQFCLFRRIHPWYGYLSFISLPGSLLNVGRIAGPVLSRMVTGGHSFGI